MARIAGVNIPAGKRVEISLRYLYGIGPHQAKVICEQIGIPAERRTSELSDDEVFKIREMIDQNYKVEGDLRREVAMNIKRLMDLGCLSRPASSQGPARSRSAHAYQCAHPQGPGQADRRQEKSHQVRFRTKDQMAEKPAAGARIRRKERKNIISGVAHVNASFNNTIITITDAQGNTIAWAPPAAPSSRDRANRRRTRRRSRPKTLAARRRSTACRPWKSK